MRRTSLTPGIRSTAPPQGRDATKEARRAAAGFVVLDAEVGRFLFGSYQNLRIAVWKDSATLSAVDRLSKAGATARAAGALGSSIHLIADGAGLPTEEGRAGLIKLRQRQADHIACVGVVVAGTGFWASAMRSAMTNLHLLGPASFDFRVLGSTEELIQWLPPVHERKTGVVLEPETLRGVVETAVSQAR